MMNAEWGGRGLGGLARRGVGKGLELGGGVAARNEFDVLVRFAHGDQSVFLVLVQESSIRTGPVTTFLRSRCKHGKNDACMVAGDPNAIPGCDFLARRISERKTGTRRGEGMAFHFFAVFAFLCGLCVGKGAVARGSGGPHPL